MSSHPPPAVRPAANPIPADARISCLSFRPLRRGTLVGFASLHWERARLRLHGVAIHRKGDKRWAQLPSRPQTDSTGNTIRDPNGKVQYAKMVEFDDSRVLDLFSRLAIDAVESYDPSAFLDAGEEVRS